MAILLHLLKTYVKIKPEMIADNKAQLDKPWDPQTPIVDLWTNVKECQDFATAANEPIPDSEVILKTLNVLRNTGLFETQITTWYHKPEAVQKDFEKLMHYFDIANEIRKKTATTSNTGYKAATASPEQEAPAKETPEEKKPAKNQALCDKSVAGAFYCWTCAPNLTHNGYQCKTRNDGHRAKATLANPMGGNLLMKAPKRKYGKHQKGGKKQKN